MTREDFKTHEKLINNWINGADIEYYDDVYGEWKLASTPKWCAGVKYRTKPIITPYTGDQLKLLVGSVIVNNKTGDHHLVLSYGRNFVRTISGNYNAKALLEEFTLMSGKPIGNE